MANIPGRNTGALSDVPYDATTWDTNQDGATKNALRDKFVSVDAAAAGLSSSKVPNTRQINTSAPLTGGGDLTGDLTLVLAAATGSVNGYLTSTDWTTFNNKVSTTRTISTTAPITGGGDLSANRTLAMHVADTSNDGYLSSTDWNTFNAKQAALTPGNLTETSSGVLTITGGSSSVLHAVTIQVKKSTSSQDGYLAAADFATFLAKQNALTFGNLTETTSSILTITGGTSAIIGSGLTIAVQQSDQNHNGFLSSTDWTTFNSKLGNSLTDAKIWIGSATTNIPTERTLSGAIVVSNSGVTTLQSGVVADANVASNAALSRSKIAAGSINHVLINDGSGLLSSESTLSPVRGGTGVANDVSQTLTRVGNFGLTLTLTALTALTLPTSGTLSTLAGTEVFTNKSISGSANTLTNIPNSATTATSSNTNSTIVARDASGNFSAGVITASSVTGLSSPSLSSDAVNKAYVDNAIAQGRAKNAVVAASIATVPGSFSAGVISTGVTAASLATQLDGVTVVDGDRVLVKNRSTASQQGIYLVSISTNVTLTRTTDADTSAELLGANVYVENGSTLGGTGWTMNTYPFTLDTDSCSWVQTSGAGTYTASGGIVLTANNFAIGTSGSNGISNSMVNTGAAIDFTKLATLTSGNILVGNVSNQAASVAVSGDITITNAGVVAIGSGKVTNTMLAGSIARTKILAGTLNYVVINDGSGNLSEEAQLAKTRGGTGITSTATFPSSGIVAVVPSSGVVKSNGSVLSSANVDLTSEVTGTLPVGNGGTGLAALGTSNQVLGVNNAGSAAEYKTVLGTSNQVVVTHGANSITLSTPQSIAAASSPTFAGLTLTSFSGVVKASAGVLSAASLVNADVSASAAIAYSKLNLGTSIVNADISASAAIAYSKLALTGAILNADLAGSIAYSKLSLTGAILNADLAGSIAYSKLSLTGAILNADLAGSIAYSKLSLTGAILNADLAGSIAYSKLVLTGAIVNGDVSSSAAIAGTKISPVFGSQNVSNTGTNVITGAADSIQLKVIANATQTTDVVQFLKSDGTTNIFKVSNLGNGTFQGTLAASNLSGTNSGDQTISLTSEASGSGTGSFAVTLLNSAVIGKVLTGYTSGAGVVAATDTILQAIQKLNGNQFGGTLAAKSADYTVTDSDNITTILMTTSTTDRTITLPSAANNANRILTFKKADSATGKLTVSRAGSDLIDGATSLVLVDQDDFYSIQSDATNWTIISKGIGYRVQSRVKHRGGAGHGSTNTKIRRIEVATVVSTGNAINPVQSATLGNSYTVKQNGWYSIIYCDRNTAAGSEAGVSVNSSQLTTSVDTITETDRRIYGATNAAQENSISSMTIYLNNGDVVRPHTDGSPNVTSAIDVYFEIQKVGL